MRSKGNAIGETGVEHWVLDLQGCISDQSTGAKHRFCKLRDPNSLCLLCHACGILHRTLQRLKVGRRINSSIHQTALHSSMPVRTFTPFDCASQDGHSSRQAGDKPSVELESAVCDGFYINTTWSGPVSLQRSALVESRGCSCVSI